MRKESGVKLAPSRGRPAIETSSPFFLYANIERALILDIVEECCSRPQRDLLLLHYGLGWPLAAIARQFRVSNSAVTQMHERALAGMRTALAQIGIRTMREI